MSAGAVIGITTLLAIITLAAAAPLVEHYRPGTGDQLAARALLAIDRLRRRLED